MLQTHIVKCLNKKETAIFNFNRFCRLLLWQFHIPNQSSSLSSQSDCIAGSLAPNLVVTVMTSLVIPESRHIAPDCASELSVRALQKYRLFNQNSEMRWEAGRMFVSLKLSTGMTLLCQVERHCSGLIWISFGVSHWLSCVLSKKTSQKYRTLLLKHF